LSAIATPIYVGSSAVLSEGWDADRAIDDMLTFGVTTSSGAAVFMSEILNALEARGLNELPLSAGYPCGGSTIPVSLAEACDDVGMRPARSWGMTECPGVTGSSPRLHSREIRTASDGLVYPGCEVRLVGDDGSDVPVGGEGEAWVRGPQRALGYLEQAHTDDAFDAEGWFCTGDMGRLSADGTFVMTGRRKEIINRGGEKMSSREIEDAIVRHELVRDVAVVSAPHPRLGEQPAAFVTASAALTAEELTTFLHELGLAPQKVPRVWRFVDELPRTASGKVVKRDLEASLADDE
jgi:acyl-CoA synthetase (AMP-forming)/AMP-acid ligase II